MNIGIMDGLWPVAPSYLALIPIARQLKKDWEFIKKLHAEFKKGYMSFIGWDEAPYSKNVFVNIIFNYCKIRAEDEDWLGNKGEIPLVHRDTIEYDPDDNEWRAYCEFTSNGIWCEMIGDTEGIITIETE